MSLYLLFLTSLVAFLILKYYVLPRATSSGNNNWLIAKLGKTALLAILKYASTFFLIATATYLVLIIVVVAITFTRGVTSSELGAVIDRIQTYRGWHKAIKPFWTMWVFAFIGFTISLLAYRREKRFCEEDVERVTADLLRERDEGRWEGLEPSQEMNELRQRIQAAQIAFDKLDPSVVNPTKEMLFAREVLGLEIKKLRELWHGADLERRVYHRLSSGDEKDYSASRSHTFVSVLGSKGFLATLQSASRTLTNVGLVLLFLSLVGLNTPLLDGALANRILHLSELQVKATQKEAKESFDKLIAENSDGGKKPDKDDQEAADGLSRRFERAFSSSHIWYVPPQSAGRDRAVRVSLVREQILHQARKNPPKGPDNPGPDDNGPGSHPSGPTDSGPGGSHTTQDREGRGPARTDSGDQRINTTKRPKTQPPDRPEVTSNGDNPASTAREDGIRQRIVRETGPQTSLGEQVSRDLQTKVMEKSGRVWARLKEKWVAYKTKFGEPFEPFEFRKFAIAETVGVIVEQSWPGGPGEVSKIGNQVTKAALKDAAKTMYETSAGHGASQSTLEESVRRIYETTWERFVNDVAGGVSVEDALERVRSSGGVRPVASISEVARLRVVSEELPDRIDLFAELKRNLKDYPPTLNERPADLMQARNAVDDLRRESGPSGDLEFNKAQLEKLDAADTYEDHYPGQIDSQTRTAKGELLTTLRSAPPDANESKELFAQSRDFVQLKSAPDVGGVLIGRSPEQGAQSVEIRDITWNTGEGGVRIVLKKADGTEVQLGPFEKDLVNQALTYVADGRKIVTTIINGNTNRQRVLMHPAMVDTQLGLDFIKFDHLVFDFLPESDPLRREAQLSVEPQMILYDLALENRRLAVLQIETETLNKMSRYGDPQLALMGINRAELRDELSTFRKAVSEEQTSLDLWLAKPSINSMASYALRKSEEITDPNHSFLKKRPEFYDQRLVAEMNTCADVNETSLQGFSKCIGDITRDQYPSISEETRTDWMKDSPRTEARSIAEEKPFRINSVLDFLSPEPGTDPAARLWPFEFRYEIAFPKKAVFATGKTKTEDYRAPWEYTSLRGPIARKVSDGIQSDKKRLNVFRRVSDFTVLQRLMRIALEGGLGEQFPIERLVDLAHDTAGSNKYVHTPRWVDPTS